MSQMNVSNSKPTYRPSELQPLLDPHGPPKDIKKVLPPEVSTQKSPSTTIKPLSSEMAMQEATQAVSKFKGSLSNVATAPKLDVSSVEVGLLDNLPSFEAEQTMKALGKAQPGSFSISSNYPQRLQLATQLMTQLQTQFPSLSSSDKCVFEAIEDFSRVVKKSEIPQGGGFAVTVPQDHGPPKVYVSLQHIETWVKDGEVGNLMNTLRHELRHAQQMQDPDHQLYYKKEYRKELEASCQEIISAVMLSGKEPVPTNKELDHAIDHAAKHAGMVSNELHGRSILYPQESAQKGLCMLAESLRFYQLERRLSASDAIIACQKDKNLQGALVAHIEKMVEDSPELQKARSEGGFSLMRIRSQSPIELCQTLYQLMDLAR